MNKLLKEARALLSDVVQRGVRVGTETRIESFLRRTAGKRSTKGKKAAVARKSAKALEHSESTASIRDAVFLRAGGWCEARPCTHQPVEMDHWLGGSGRRREQQAVGTCWALCHIHHGARTRNIGSAKYWNEKFAAHCLRHGYSFTPHIEHEPLTRKAT